MLLDRIQFYFNIAESRICLASSIPWGASDSIHKRTKEPSLVALPQSIQRLIISFILVRLPPEKIFSVQKKKIVSPATDPSARKKKLEMLQQELRKLSKKPTISTQEILREAGELMKDHRTSTDRGIENAMLEVMMKSLSENASIMDKNQKMKSGTTTFRDGIKQKKKRF